MIRVVPGRVVRAVPEPEVRPQVDDRLVAGEELVDPLRDHAVGERQEHGLRVLGHMVVDVQVARGQVRVDVRDRIALALAADEAGDLHVGVQGEQADQLRADVAGCADDRDADLTFPPQGS